MMNELIEELSKQEYNNKTDQQAADMVNAKRVIVRQNVENWLIKRHAVLNGYWPKIKIGQSDVDQHKSNLCVSVIDWIDDKRINSTDLTIPQVQSMITGLVAYNFMTQQHADELNALGNVEVSWTSTVGLPEIGIGLVQNARKEIK